MQGMVWNPVVLLLSLITQYNMSVLEIEVSIYLILSSIGMYMLLKSFSFSRITCIIGAVSYMSCGYMVDSASVIPWISSAAYIPFVLASMHKLLTAPRLSTAIFFALSLSLFFVSCYPGLFIFTIYITVFILFFFLLYAFQKKEFEKIKSCVAYLSLSLVAFLSICSPAIVSSLEFLPYYARGSAISHQLSITNPFPAFSFISYFLPNAVSQPHDWIPTDRSMRNAYIGLFLFCCFCLSLTHKLSFVKRVILCLTLFAFLFSWRYYTSTGVLF